MWRGATLTRKKGKKKDDLRLPTFDEKEFMRKEMRHAIMMVATIGLAILMAIVAGALTWTLRDARIPFVLGLLAMFLLKFVFDLLRIDTSDMEKTKWAGTLFTYFLTFVAIWVLLLNPPIIDMVAPTIEDRTQGSQELGSEVTLRVYVSDNQGISKVTVDIDTPDGSSLGPFDMIKQGRNIYTHVIASPVLGTYNFTVGVKDEAGFFTDAKYSFKVITYAPPTVTLYGQNDGDTIPKGQSVRVQITDNAGIVLAWYSLDPYDPYNVSTLSGVKETRLRMDNPKDSVVEIQTKSWSPGPHTITVCAMDAVPHTTVCEVYSFSIT